MTNDISEAFANFSKMIGNQNHFTNHNSNTSTADSQNCNNTEQNNENQNATRNTDKTSTTNNPFGNIDIETIMKMQKIISTMNESKNDSRTNLLLSLKPYLKESRKSKIDQYIQFMKMEKIIEMFGNSGGDVTHV